LKKIKEVIKNFLAYIPAGPRETESIPIDNAVDRVLSEEVTAMMDVPHYSRSTTDGYLILASNTALASPRRPITFEVKGEIPPPSQSVELPLGASLKVKNGSYMAIKRFLEGHYAVLKESDTVVEMVGKISIARRVEKHENIVVQGSTLKNGNILFPKGHRIRSGDIFTLASQGILKVSVAKPPKVGIFSIGNELLPPTIPYKIGCKFDCNSYGLSALVSKVGGIPVFCGIMPDRLTPLAEKIIKTVSKEEVDMVILSGGTAAGGRKFTVDLMNGAGTIGLSDPEAIVDRMKWAVIAAEDIRPNVLGILEKKPVICLAGQPTQAAHGFRHFAWPVISYLLGEKKSD
jgi:molybdopterin molybdotransferase